MTDNSELPCCSPEQCDAQVSPSPVEERRRALHPTFYPDTGIWEVSGHRAYTLRNLLSQFPPGTEFVGYYPQGYVAPSLLDVNEGRKAADAHALMLAREAIAKEVKIRRHPERANPGSPGPRMHKRKYNHEAVLDLWAADHDSQYIEMVTGVPMNAIGGIVMTARDAGDVRAKRRKTGRKSKYHDAPPTPVVDGQVSA